MHESDAYGNVRSIKLPFLLVENNKTIAETKFHGHRVNIDKIIKLQKVTFNYYLFGRFLFQCIFNIILQCIYYFIPEKIII